MLNERLTRVEQSGRGTPAFVCGADVTIADFAIYAWVRMVRREKIRVFLRFDEEYPAVLRYYNMMGARAAVQRGARVSAYQGADAIKERHSRKDFD